MAKLDMNNFSSVVYIVSSDTWVDNYRHRIYIQHSGADIIVIMAFCIVRSFCCQNPIVCISEDRIVNINGKIPKMRFKTFKERVQ